MKAPRVVVRYGASGKLCYFSVDDDVWVDADQGIWVWGWEDKLIEVGHEPRASSGY